MYNCSLQHLPGQVESETTVANSPGGKWSGKSHSVIRRMIEMVDVGVCVCVCVRGDKTAAIKISYKGITNGTYYLLDIVGEEC